MIFLIYFHTLVTVIINGIQLLLTIEKLESIFFHVNK